MCAESLPQTDPPGTTLFTYDECWKASLGSAGVGAMNAPAYHRNGGGLDLSAACAEAPAGKHVMCARARNPQPPHPPPPLSRAQHRRACSTGMTATELQRYGVGCTAHDVNRTTCTAALPSTCGGRFPSPPECEVSTEWCASPWYPWLGLAFPLHFPRVRRALHAGPT